MKLQDVILKAMAKRITWLEAAEIIGVCDRTMRRMRERYQEFGYDGLFDQRHRKRTTLRVPLEIAEHVLKLYQETYFDLSIRHFHEKLRRKEELSQVVTGRGLGSAAPSLRLDLPDAIAVGESVCEGTGPNHGLALDSNCESPRYNRIGGRTLDIPEAHLVRQVFLGDTKALTPFLYVSEPIGRSIWIQPAIGCNAVDDDRCVSEHAKETVAILAVKAVNVGVNETLDF